MRRAALVAIVLGSLGLSGCFTGAQPEAWTTERAECEAGVADALGVLGSRATAPVRCSAVVTRAFYDATTNTAWIDYRDDPNVGPHYYAQVTAHELGHAWDRWNGVPSASARYKAIRGYAPEAWPLEGYADDFARLTFDPEWWGYGPPLLSPEQAAAICSEGLVPC